MQTPANLEPQVARLSLGGPDLEMQCLRGDPGTAAGSHASRAHNECRVPVGRQGPGAGHRAQGQGCPVVFSSQLQDGQTLHQLAEPCPGQPDPLGLIPGHTEGQRRGEVGAMGSFAEMAAETPDSAETPPARTLPELLPQAGQGRGGRPIHHCQAPGPAWLRPLPPHKQEQRVQGCQGLLPGSRGRPALLSEPQLAGGPACNAGSGARPGLCTELAAWPRQRLQLAACLRTPTKRQSSGGPGVGPAPL